MTCQRVAVNTRVYKSRVSHLAGQTLSHALAALWPAGAARISYAARCRDCAESCRDWFGSLPRFADHSFGAAQDDLPAGTRKALNASVPAEELAPFADAQGRL
jgi:hypothetical protein